VDCRVKPGNGDEGGFHPLVVMPGLDPGIHSTLRGREGIAGSSAVVVFVSGLKKN
jgi:hypothetical protein